VVWCFVCFFALKMESEPVFTNPESGILRREDPCETELWRNAPFVGACACYTYTRFSMEQRWCSFRRLLWANMCACGIPTIHSSESLRYRMLRNSVGRLNLEIVKRLGVVRKFRNALHREWQRVFAISLRQNTVKISIFERYNCGGERNERRGNWRPCNALYGIYERRLILSYTTRTVCASNFSWAVLRAWRQPLKHPCKTATG